MEDVQWGNDAFTKAMLERARRCADSGKLGYFETDELAVFARGRVMAMTKGKGVQELAGVKPNAAPEMKLVLPK